MASKADSTFSHLVQVGKRYPMLTQAREREIIDAWQERAEPAALDELVGSHLRLVVKIARGFAGYGLPMADLVSEGNVGLIRAVNKFDAARDVRFASYAKWWVRSAIQQYVLRSWSLVRIGTTAAQRRLFFNLRRLKAKLEAVSEERSGSGSPRGDRDRAGCQGSGRRPHELAPRRRRQLAQRRSRRCGKRMARVAA